MSLFQHCKTLSGVGYEKCVNANLGYILISGLKQTSIDFGNLTIIWTKLIPFIMVLRFRTGLHSILKFKHSIELKTQLYMHVYEKTLLEEFKASHLDAI